MTMSLQALAIQTLTTPAEAARTILSRDWPREALWAGLFLGLVLNTLFYALQQMLYPVPEAAQMIRMGSSAYLAMNLAIQLALIGGITLAGRFFSGQGRADQVMALMIWLLILQAAAHAVMLLLILVSPVLAVLMNLAVVVVGFFIMLHFVNVVHGLGSLFKAFAVVMMAGVIVIAALTLFLNLFGFSILGLTANV